MTDKLKCPNCGRLAIKELPFGKWSCQKCHADGEIVYKIINLPKELK